MPYTIGSGSTSIDKENCVSSETVQSIIERALEDADFRDKLLDDTRAAVSGYELSEQELQCLETAKSDAFQGELEARISKRRMGGKFGSFTGPMGIDGAVE